MKIGDKVTYQKGKTTKTGIIHGIRRAADENGLEKVVGYIVDTGKVDYKIDQYDENGKKIDPFVQPLFADLDPEDVTLAD